MNRSVSRRTALAAVIAGAAAAGLPHASALASDRRVAAEESSSASTAYRYSVNLESWAHPWVSDPKAAHLANLPSYVGTVVLCFMQPDAQYTRGSYSFQGTGVQFSFDGTVVRDAVSLLRERNPGVEVLVSVGGATYHNWAGLNVRAIADFVRDFGLDGVEVCYEPSGPGCVPSGGGYTCRTDAEYTSIVKEFSKALPTGSTLAVAAFHVGAYGEGAWANSQPVSAYTGISLGLLRSDAASAITRLNVMAYDASTVYNPKEALAAYQHYFKGPVLLGVQIAPEAWPQEDSPYAHVLTLDEVKDLANEVKARGAGGMSLWSLYKQPKSGTPSAREVSQTICDALELGDSTQPWPW
ncbi:glycosyl hydrolase family 18 protein [Streptomyces sp. NPDC057682]|uniref:glycosyl hydrolase family 18 protein n=1 Tax=Streptomyces sp. NPDC057682 TaxID=3346210 RepID=UPI0036B12453